KTVRIWDVGTGREQITVAAPSPVMSVAFSSDGRQVACGNADGKVRIWDWRTERPAILNVDGQSAEVTGVTFSLGGQHLASAGADLVVKVWDAHTGQHCLTFSEPRGGAAWGSVAFSADCQLLAGAGVERTVKVWDARNGRELYTLQGHEDQVWQVAF